MKQLPVAGIAAVLAVLSANVLFGGESQIALRLSEAVIVKAKAGGSEYAALKTAAQDLSAIISNITGRAAAIYDEGREPKGACAFYLGDSLAAKAAGLDGSGMRNGDWRMKCVPGKAFLFGKTGFAANCAVFDFAERNFGYFVFTPDGNDTFTPKSDIAIPVGDITVRPAIYSREVYHAMSDSRRNPETKKLWDRYSRALGTYAPASIEGQYRVSSQTKKRCHTSFAYLPPDKYFKDHPEYYSMGPDGKRHGTPQSNSQLCYTHPETYRLVRDALFGFVEADRKKNPKNPPLVYDFTQQDNSAFLCLCPSCKEVIAKYDRVPGGHNDGGDAGLQLEFVNRLARDVAAKYPGVQIRTFAYVSTERAPRPGTISVEPNVRIWWCDVYSKSDHTIPLQTKGHFNEFQVQELSEWFSLTANIEVWDYMLYNSAGLEVAADAIKSDAQLFAGHNIPCIFMETENWGRPPFYALNYYLISKLYVNPNRNVERMIRAFCRSYGAAADEMFGLIKFLRGEIAARPAKTKGEWHSRRLPWLQDCDMLENLSLLAEKAYAKTAGDDLSRGRIVPVLSAIWRNLLLEYKKRPSAKLKYAEARERFRRYAKEEARISFMEPKNRAKAEKGVDDMLELLTMKFTDLPDELAEVPEDELVFVDTNFRQGGQRVKDPVSTRGHALSVKTSLPMPCGVYDRPSKQSFGFGRKFAKDEIRADAYRWFKLGQCHVGRESIFWFPGSWSCDFVLKDFHILSDGMETDPNWYDLWASARYEDGAIFIDRLTLRRISPPDSGKKTNGSNRK